MPNAIKRAGDGGFALQVTKPARAAGLVEEDEEGNATRLADVRVYAFDDLLLVIDIDTVDDEDGAELVASAARATASIHQAIDAGVSIAGNGYQVQLPPANDAGFEIGDSAPCHPAPGVLAISPLEEGRVAMSLLEHRRAQVDKNQSSLS